VYTYFFEIEFSSLYITLNSNCKNRHERILLERRDLNDKWINFRTFPNLEKFCLEYYEDIDHANEHIE
jgi:hypothetical protein